MTQKQKNDALKLAVDAMRKVRTDWGREDCLNILEAVLLQPVASTPAQPEHDREMWTEEKENDYRWCKNFFETFKDKIPAEDFRAWAGIYG